MADPNLLASELPFLYADNNKCKTAPTNFFKRRSYAACRRESPIEQLKSPVYVICMMQTSKNEIISTFWFCGLVFDTGPGSMTI
jgi:hypothetical protein